VGRKKRKGAERAAEDLPRADGRNPAVFRWRVGLGAKPPAMLPTKTI
jgi:hypothetical protein